MSAPDVVARVLELRDQGLLRDAAALVDALPLYATVPGDFDQSLAAAVLEEWADSIRGTDVAAADDAYTRAAEFQRELASTATSGGEGIARSEEANRIEAKRTR